MRLKPLHAHLDGYGSMSLVEEARSAPDATTDAYADEQGSNNVRVTREYLEPILRRTQSHTVLDIGCGVGTAVSTLVADGYEAFGVDLAPLTRRWVQAGADRSRLFVVDASTLDLPFHDNEFDFVFTFGVIEHVGTSDGHATRRPDLHDRRRQWLREVYRVVRPGGHLLLGGPNREFPLDFSHGSDAAATGLERGLSAIAGVTVHRIWGEHFLWAYRDVSRYLDGLPFRMQGLSLDGLLRFGRMPRALRPLAHLYLRTLPGALRGTGLNPWVMALVTKTAD